MTSTEAARRSLRFLEGTDEHRVLRGTRETAIRFSAVARAVPDLPAVSDLSDTVSYERLDRRVASTAAAIEEAGPSARTLLASDDPIAFTVGMLASAVAGRTSVVIPSGSSTDAVVALAKAIGPTVMLVPEVDSATVPTVPAIRISGSEADGSTLRDVAGFISERDHRGAPWERMVTLDNTSGSTGNPRLIGQFRPLGHGRVVAPLGELDVEEHLATIATSSSAFRMRVSRAVLSGAMITGFSLGEFAPVELLHRLAAARPTLLALTPTLLRHLHRMHRASPGLVTLPTVDEVQVIGEQLRWPDVALARALCGSTVTVRNLYGSTEAGLVTQRVVPPDEPVGEGPVPVGRPIPGRRVWVAGDDGSPAPVGHSGTVVIEGAFDAEGVPLERLAGGEERFVSGDVGRIDSNGELWIEGRSDRTTKVAGSRVDLGSVEDVLRALPGLRDAVVLPIEVGPSEVRLIAHVVVSDATVDARRLRQLASNHLSSMAVPFRFILHAAPFPTLPTGKVDLRSLSASLETEGPH
jgi:acyl-coenzyme A synthetase/AMP-(fatty) acid ligase